MTVRDAIARTRNELLARHVVHGSAESEWLVAHILGLDRAALFLDPERALTTEEKEQLLDSLDRRLSREPLQYILGDVEFCGCTIEVSPGVLIPRPETEWIVETVLAEGWGRDILSVLDVGTGSGAIAVALASRWRTVRVTAIDLSPVALRLARRNVNRNDVTERVQLIRADLHFFPFQTRSFDLIISNPPYIRSDHIPGLPPEVVGHEPLLALDGGSDGLTCYKALATDSDRLLTATGRMVMELPGYGPDAIVRLFRASGYDSPQVTSDWAKKPRLLSVRKQT